MIQNSNKVVRRGEVYLIDFKGQSGSNLQLGLRPAICVGNNASNLHSNVISVIPLTTSATKFNKMLPTHVKILTSNSGIKKDSIAMGEQTTLISKDSIVSDEPLFKLSDNLMEQIDNSLSIQFGLTSKSTSRVNTSRMAYAMA